MFYLILDIHTVSEFSKEACSIDLIFRWNVQHFKTSKLERKMSNVGQIENSRDLS